MLQGEKEEREAWRLAPLPDLIRHLVGTCHADCRQDLAQLETLVELAALMDADQQPELLDIRDLASRFCVGMRAHLALEERNLFPAILAQAAGRVPAADLETLRTLLEGDHEGEAALLRTLRTLTSGLAGRTPGSVLERIHDTVLELASRLQKHFYLEVQILFARSRQIG